MQTTTTHPVEALNLDHARACLGTALLHQQSLDKTGILELVEEARDSLAGHSHHMHEAAQIMFAALVGAYTAIDAINPHDEAVGALNHAGLAHGLVQAQRDIFSAISRATGRT